MNRKMQFTLISFFVLLLANLAHAEAKLTKLVKEIQPAVVTVITYDSNKKGLGQGTGFFVDKKGHLITNYHVLKGAYCAEVLTYDGKKYPIKSIVSENKPADLIKVLVDIHEQTVHWVKVTKALPHIAESVLVVGSPMGLEQTVTEGIVSAVREVPNLGRMFQISAPISPGSSGSPVVNMKGEVIGVATSQVVEGQNLNFAVSGKHALSLNQEKTGKTVSEWTRHITQEKLKVVEELVRKGRAFYKNEEFRKAIPFFKKALEENPTYAKAWNDLGYCFHRLGFHKKGINALKRAIEIEPNDWPPYLWLGDSYQSLGLDREALEAYKHIISINPDHIIGYSRSGIAYAFLGLHKEAIEAYKQVIRIDPDDWLAYHNLGLSYSRLGRYDEAIEAHKQAIRIIPDSADSHYSLGVAYLKAGKKGAALEEYKILKGLDKNQSDILFDYIYQ